MAWLDTLEEIRKRDWSEVSEPEREETAGEVITISSYASALTSIVPVPLAELALLIPVHTAMVMTIGHIFGRPVSRTEAKRVALELGAVAGLSFAGRAAISALKKLLLPVYGGVLAAPATFALTWGLGRASIEYFKNPNLSREDLRKVFSEAMSEGKSIFSTDAFDRFRKDNPDSEDAAEPDPTDEEPSDAEAEVDPEAAEKAESLRPKKRSF